MSARDQLKNVIKLLRTHEDLLIDSYLEYKGELTEYENDYKTIDALTHGRLAWLPASDEPVRLTRELTLMFDRVLRDPRRLTLDTNIGGFLENLENAVDQYKKASRRLQTDDAISYLNQIEQFVDELRSNLLDSSNQLWQKINSDFGYVSSLDLKIKENELVLSQAKRINDGIELIKVTAMEELAGSDRQLRRYLVRWLLNAVDQCRKETSDAIHRLNELLFEYRQKQRVSKLIDGFYQKFQADPGYRPSLRMIAGEIPQLFNQVAGIDFKSQADFDDPLQESTLVGIIDGLRKEKIQSLQELEVRPIEVLDKIGSVQVVPDLLGQAVDNFFVEVLNTGSSLLALDYYPSHSIEPDPEIWLLAVISRYNIMIETERKFFKLDYIESIDSVFNGLHYIHDVNVSYRETV